MRKVFKSRKALSPVVAAIILIAVTVAVSIAVAAWMGALTIGFMGGREELKIIDARFPTANTLNVTVSNIGPSKVVLTDVRVDGASCTVTSPSLPYTLDKGLTVTITATFQWEAGKKYEILVVTSQGTMVPYTATAPS